MPGRYIIMWVMPVKYRRALIDERVERVMIETAKGIGERYEIEIEALGMDKDHVHLLCGAHPKIAPGSIVMKFKSIIARELFERERWLKKELWGREFLEFRVLRGNGWGKRELGDGGEICIGPGPTEGGFASVNTVVANFFFSRYPDARVGEVHFVINQLI